MSKVLHVAESLQGGIASYLTDLYCGFANSDGSFEHALVYPGEQGRFLDLDRVPFVTLFPVAYPQRTPLHLLRFALSLMSTLRAYRPQIIHAHSTFAGVLVRLLSALGFGVKASVVYCPHGWAMDRTGSFVTSTLAGWTERFLARYSDAIVAISKHEMTTALELGLDGKRVHLIENAVSQPVGGQKASWRQSDDCLRLLFVGRFDQQKGADIACEIVERLSGIRQVKLTLVGEPVVGRSPKMRIPAGSSVLGWVDRKDLYSLYRDADILLVPSRWEGFGLVVVESMSVGTPVIASSVGGLSSIITPGCDGLLFQSGSVNEAVELLSNLTPTQVEFLGRNALETYSHRFRLEREVDQLANLYKKVMCAPV